MDWKSNEVIQSASQAWQDSRAEGRGTIRGESRGAKKTGSVNIDSLKRQQSFQKSASSSPYREFFADRIDSPKRRPVLVTLHPLVVPVTAPVDSSSFIGADPGPGAVPNRDTTRLDAGSQTSPFM